GSGSLKMPRSIDGQGLRTTSSPPLLGGNSLPVRSTTAASTPKNGSVAVPGLQGVTPGSGVIMMQPVSVCHHVSTIGQRSPPMTVWYQSHAFGLIGSPTVPSSRSLSRLNFLTCSVPHFTHARIAVGAV